MRSARVWLVRILVMVAIGLLVVSWILPWWSCIIAELGTDEVMIIHPWGLEQNLGPFTEYAAGAEMPVWFAPIMWTYLGIAIMLLLFSLLAKEKAVSLGKFKLSLPQVLIGGVGLSYIIIVVLAVIVAAIRTGDFYDTHLIGESYFDLGGYEPRIESYVYAGLRFGYWLACAVGPLCVVLALLRDRIIGKPKLSA